MGLAHGRLGDGGCARAREIGRVFAMQRPVESRGADFMFGAATHFVLAHVLFLLGRCDPAAVAAAAAAAAPPLRPSNF